MKPPSYYWYSKQGSLTPDNRDFCGIAEAYRTTLCILVDGATSSPKGGELARALVCHLLESFVRLVQPPSSDNMIDLLVLAHTDLRRLYPADSASYIIALGGSNHFVTTLHAGDCRLGRITRHGTIQWQTAVHSLATAIHDLKDHELSSDPNRHQLTRAFKGRRFQPPECNISDFQDSDSSLLLASDGFWADLPEDEQLNVLRGLPIERKPLGISFSWLAKDPS